MKTMNISKETVHSLKGECVVGTTLRRSEMFLALVGKNPNCKVVVEEFKGHNYKIVSFL